MPLSINTAAKLFGHNKMYPSWKVYNQLIVSVCPLMQPQKKGRKLSLYVNKSFSYILSSFFTYFYTMKQSLQWKFKLTAAIQQVQQKVWRH